MKLAMDAVKLTYSPYMAADWTGFICPGMSLGSVHNKDWGAKFGIFLCELNSIYTVIQLVIAFIK